MGYTQEAVAVECGVTPHTVANWEAGRTMPTLPVLTDLCTLYATTPNALLLDETPGCPKLSRPFSITFTGCESGGSRCHIAEAFPADRQFFQGPAAQLP